MEYNLSELVSKIRYELLIASKEVKYLTNTFNYFNVIYGDITEDKTVERNPASEIKNKSELLNRSSGNVNAIFEQVFDSLKNQAQIDRHSSPDFMKFYAYGLFAVEEIGELNELNKLSFYKSLIEQYNHEYNFSFKSIDEVVLAKRSRKDFESGDEN